MDIDLRMIINDSSYFKAAAGKNKDPIEQEDLALQELMLPTTMCSLIQCNYFLEVHIEHKGLTFNSSMPPGITPI